MTHNLCFVLIARFFSTVFSQQRKCSRNRKKLVKYFQIKQNSLSNRWQRPKPWKWTVYSFTQRLFGILANENMKIWKWIHGCRHHIGCTQSAPKSVGCCTLANYEAGWKVKFVDNQMFNFHRLIFSMVFLFIFCETDMHTRSDDTTAAARETKLNIYTERRKTEEYAGYVC